MPTVLSTPWVIARGVHRLRVIRVDLFAERVRAKA
jgi:hypothetical protein